LDGEVENVLTAIGWAMTTGRPFTDLLYTIAVSTWLFWIVRGQYRRFPPNLVEVVRSSPLAANLTELDWTVVRFGAAGGSFSSGRFEEVVELLTDQAPIAEAAGRATEAGVMLMALAASRPYERDGPARAEFEHARELVDDEMNLGYVLVHMGSLLLADGDVAGARALQEESLRIAEELGDPNLSAESHFQLAHDAVDEGKLDEARAHAAAAAEHYLSADHLEGESFTLGTLAGIAVASGDAALAARLLGAAAALRDPIELRPWPLVGEIERRYAQRARDALGDEAFDGEYAAGRDLSPHAAIELGLEARVTTTR
jgi:tetratricopeptide (TPR) repeat protein